VAIASDAFNSTQAKFQVYALEGVGMGIEDGKFAGTDKNPKTLFDEDIDGLEEAGKNFRALVQEAMDTGFEPITFMDMLEYESKLRRS